MSRSAWPSGPEDVRDLDQLDECLAEGLIGLAEYWAWRPLVPATAPARTGNGPSDGPFPAAPEPNSGPPLLTPAPYLPDDQTPEPGERPLLAGLPTSPAPQDGPSAPEGAPDRERPAAHGFRPPDGGIDLRTGSSAEEAARPETGRSRSRWWRRS
ncbi:hypothetical protein [Austwickia chelonae]|uniref:hypothetical protein n=1 Tax=Austwickia chelonae TaxID=100225 RepID=UPI000E24D0B0|nr:hypothetical protein [Austwickia chelonae]